MTKTKVILLYGGQSTEHDISRRSAKFIFDNLLASDYETIPVAINKEGQWIAQDLETLKAHAGESLPIASQGQKLNLFDLENPLDAPLGDGKPVVVFPALHGTHGEDGVCQGLFQLKNWAFVGPDTLGSAVAMDKIVAKTLVHAAGIPIAPFVPVYRGDCRSEQDKSLVQESILSKLKPPFFVKPASLGSSVGITRVDDIAELQQAIELALTYDHKVLVEKAMIGREIEFALLGGEKPLVSGPGEVAASRGFYTFEEKYSRDSVAKVIIPAPMSNKEKTLGQSLSLDVFRALNLWGMARVDFFLDQTGRFVFNEANTIPGFTSISQYPQLWREEGIHAKELIERLIQTALERWYRKQMIQLNY